MYDKSMNKYFIVCMYKNKLRISHHNSDCRAPSQSFAITITLFRFISYYLRFCEYRIGYLTFEFILY